MARAALNLKQAGYQAFAKSRLAHWNLIPRFLERKQGGKYYHKRLIEIYSFLTLPGQRVLEIGCGHGDLLAAVQPAFGLGVDFSSQIVIEAQKRHPTLHFCLMDANALALNGPFDVIIFSDLLNDVWDVQTVFEQIQSLVTPRTRIILNSYSLLWEQPLALMKRLQLATPTLYQNWLTVGDLSNLLNLAGFEVIRSWPEILFPLPLLPWLFNRLLVRLWPFYHLALTNFIVAQPDDCRRTVKQPTVSVVIPARNEAGNIKALFERVPAMGQKTELVFVEGHSRDDTYQQIEQAMRDHPQRCASLYRQRGTGKGDAVRLGFEKASGDILMILDADMTVSPEDLPKFYQAIVEGKGEFINGVRLVYPMEKQAMRFLNLLGNKFFSLVFTWLLGQPIRDTLCGTKVLWRSDYQKIVANRSYFGDFDPFGDFDLLFGAAKLNLNIVDMPIRYRERTYGTTNIQRWKHGWLLMRMVLFAANRIKFV